MFAQGISEFYLRSMKHLAPNISSMQRYRKCTKTTSFIILGFSRPRVKLWFDFPGVLLNQKYQPWSLNFDFYEDRNPILGSLKNSSLVKSPNLLQHKLKMPEIKLCFDRKMRPSMEVQTSLLLLMDCGERPKLMFIENLL